MGLVVVGHERFRWPGQLLACNGHASMYTLPCRQNPTARPVGKGDDKSDALLLGVRAARLARAFPVGE